MPFTEVRIDLPAGALSAYHSQPDHPAPGPAIVFLHGLFRRSEVLFHWQARLGHAADILFIDLPGHAGSAAMAPTLPELSEVMKTAKDYICGFGPRFCGRSWRPVRASMSSSHSGEPIGRPMVSALRRAA